MRHSYHPGAFGLSTPGRKECDSSDCNRVGRIVVGCILVLLGLMQTSFVLEFWAKPTSSSMSAGLIGLVVALGAAEFALGFSLLWRSFRPR